MITLADFLELYETTPFGSLVIVDNNKMVHKNITATNRNSILSRYGQYYVKKFSFGVGPLKSFELTISLHGQHKQSLKEGIEKLN